MYSFLRSTMSSVRNHNYLYMSRTLFFFPFVQRSKTYFKLQQHGGPTICFSYKDWKNHIFPLFTTTLQDAYMTLSQHRWISLHSIGPNWIFVVSRLNNRLHVVDTRSIMMNDCEFNRLVLELKRYFEIEGGHGLSLGSVHQKC